MIHSNIQAEKHWTLDWQSRILSSHLGPVVNSLVTFNKSLLLSGPQISHLQNRKFFFFFLSRKIHGALDSIKFCTGEINAPPIHSQIQVYLEPVNVTLLGNGTFTDIIKLRSS